MVLRNVCVHVSTTPIFKSLFISVYRKPSSCSKVSLSSFNWGGVVMKGIQYHVTPCKMVGSDVNLFFYQIQPFMQ